MIKYMSCIRHLGEGFCENYMNTSKYAGEIAVVADIGEKFIYEIWQLMRIINLEYIQKQEKEYLCCGWDNAFDHCNVKFKLSLIYRWVVLEEHQDYLKSIAPYSQNNEDHDSGVDIDYYGGNYNSSDDSESDSSYRLASATCPQKTGSETGFLAQNLDRDFQRRISDRKAEQGFKTGTGF